MEEIQIVDFSKSSISLQGDTTGVFKLASLLNSFCEAGNANTFVLAENVMAGNVYSSESLIKTPPYLFQLIASKNYQKILRTDVDVQRAAPTNENKPRDQILDTEGNIFGDNINIDVRYNIGSKIESLNDIIKYSKSFNLNGRISLDLFQQKFAIEFPVRHLNIHEKKERWQIETGPILFPIFSNCNNKCSYIPAFVFFSSLTKADVFLDYPFKKRIFPKYKDNVVTNLECDINLFGR